MREGPILFSGPMVQAILAGRKTQTRRVVKPQPFRSIDGEWYQEAPGSYPRTRELWECPFGEVGDRLWVRETWTGESNSYTKRRGIKQVSYRADEEYRCGKMKQYLGKWRPSIFMPRWASRITLEITGVRVERVQDISDADIEREGLWGSSEEYRSEICINRDSAPALHDTRRKHFKALWDSLHGKGAWDRNDWVWVIEFKVVHEKP